MPPVPAWIGLGSNLDDPPAQLRRALEALARAPDITLQAVSPFYTGAPMGPADQPDYVNAAARIATMLAPAALLAVLQTIEQQQGRVRGRHWGERTLDLDLLLYANARIRTDTLVVPHPGLAERRFVLQPLVDIDPALQLPDGTPVLRLLAECTAPPLTRLADPAAN
jgi:2-amino-4-hydroxy-6-hydroxymethyldihydropteridine diphosphokinase